MKEKLNNIKIGFAAYKRDTFKMYIPYIQFYKVNNDGIIYDFGLDSGIDMEEIKNLEKINILEKDEEHHREIIDGYSYILDDLVYININGIDLKSTISREAIEKFID
jgi:hypothetical protein